MSAGEPEQSSLNSDKLVEILKNSTSFEIFIHLSMNRELSLSQLTSLINKSKPTLHRHIKQMIECNLIFLSKEMPVRGNILAKFYKISETAKHLPHYSLEQIKSMDYKNKKKFYNDTRDVVNSTINFEKKGLDELLNFMDNFAMTTENLDNFFSKLPDFVINLNFLSEKQFQGWLKLHSEFMFKFIQMMEETEKNNPDSDKPYLYFTSVLPLMKYLSQKLIKEKENQQNTEKKNNK